MTSVERLAHILSSEDTMLEVFGSADTSELRDRGARYGVGSHVMGTAKGPSISATKRSYSGITTLALSLLLSPEQPRFYIHPVQPTGPASFS